MRKTCLHSVLLAIALLCVLAASAQGADRIYWADFDTGTIQWANLDGSGGIHELNPGGATISPEGYGAGGTIDAAQGRYYWVNQYDQKINWANLDGSGGGDLNIGAAKVTSSSYGLSVDPVGRRVYWGSDGSIEYANLDGSGGGTLDIGTASVNSGVATTIDPATGTIYWANAGSGSNSIYLAKLDGSGGSQLKISGSGPIEYPFGVAIDKAAQKIYWSNDSGPSTISVADLNGTNSAEVPRRGLELEGTYGIALDPEAGRVYTALFAGNALAYLNTNGSGGATLPISLPKNTGPNFPVLYKEPRATSAPELIAKPPPSVKFKAKKGKRKRPAPLPKLVGSRLTCSGGEFAPDLVEAHLYRAPEAVSRSVTVEGQPLSGDVAARPGDYRCLATGTNVAGSATATSPAVAIFKTGQLRRNLENGTAKLTVLLPGERGSLKLTAKGFKTVTKMASGRATVNLRPKGAKKAKLAADGELEAIVKLAFTPTAGAPANLRSRVTLKQR